MIINDDMLKNYMKNQQKSSPKKQGIYFLPSVLCISQEKQQRGLFSRKHNQTVSKSSGISQSYILHENTTFCIIHKTLDIYFHSISC